ncbi:extracellular solute-binding protein [Ramlibacter henchirensis]|uniref:Extracellular solute-binding protein n=1 Tax=Ramlibacter henchirensis TaxID=204072 RepID=A0A4Z0BW51_9BURK|nr:extracellular solute-binding protein [Ramlibacter henchirensis]TFZ02590.1 extracellular solute-binding protein [Ramlibacter henchirensis]
MTFSRRQAIAAAAAATLICGKPGFAQDTAWAGSPANATAIQKLYDEAVAAKQSQVVVYGGYSALYKPLWEVFTKRFPNVTVVPNPLTGPRLVSKLDAEFAAGKTEADVLMAGMTELLYNVSKDRVTPYKPPNFSALPARFADPDGKFLIMFADAYGTLYNTTQIKPADAPKSITDLADPRLKGQFVLDNPLGGGGATLVWIELFNSGLIDPKLMRGIRDNAQVVPSVPPLYPNVGAGSVKMIAWGSFTRYLQMKEAGSPVGFAFIDKGVVPLFGGTAIMKGAPNEKAARLFQAWFLTPEAQEAVVSKGHSYPVLPGVKTPAEWKPLTELMAPLKMVPPAEYVKVRADYENVARQALQ